MAMLWQMAVSCHQRGEMDRAEPIYRELLRHHPDNPAPLQMLATLRLQCGDAMEALGLFERVLTVRTDAVEVWSNRGIALRALGRLDEAVASFDRALVLAPAYMPALNNRSATLGDLQRLDEALADLERVLQVHPELPELHNNRGVLLQDLGRFDEALQAYDRAIALAPDYADAHWNEARCRLLLGDYQTGWVKYEWRWQRSDASAPQRGFKQPRWDGAPLHGKTILLYAEQGLGDTIQFLRFVPAVQAAGGRAVLEVQRGLLPFAQRMADVEVFVAGDALPKFDLHCPLMSLPHALGTQLATLPAGVPYLSADAGRCAEWAERLGERRGLRVGIMWCGNPAQKDNHLRSLHLRELVACKHPDITFISLQKDLADDEERSIVASGQVLHFGASLDDTAALMMNLDLVISVCTSMAHLAGALGRPLWVLLQSASDWRWLRDRDDSPWYPSARLFRQQRSGEWAPVIQRVADSLAVFSAR
ncbi:tetratricopeptide repeat protein [Viridibacterium curvum]|uniref:Tetratricopeptide repeat protein n=2 Tax=Viridibacterium curvum TaxID=1101404 RepID=A0ABP9R034_9RHOO